MNVVQKRITIVGIKQLAEDFASYLYLPQVTIEIHPRFESGVPKHLVRTVTENCRTLRFTSAGFEEA